MCAMLCAHTHLCILTDWLQSVLRCAHIWYWTTRATGNGARYRELNKFCNYICVSIRPFFCFRIGWRSLTFTFVLSAALRAHTDRHPGWPFSIDRYGDKANVHCGLQTTNTHREWEFETSRWTLARDNQLIHNCFALLSCEFGSNFIYIL